MGNDNQVVEVSKKEAGSKELQGKGMAQNGEILEQKSGIRY